MSGGVEYIFPQEGVDCEIKAFNQAGKEVDVPHRIVVQPYFYRRDMVASVIYARTVADVDKPDSTVQRSVLLLPGSSGKLRLESRQEMTTPAIAEDPVDGEPVAGEEGEDDEYIEEGEEDDRD